MIAPDSFKGSLSAQEVASAIGTGIHAAIPDAEVLLCPIADGGEGTLDALLQAGGELRQLRVRGAAGTLLDAKAGLLSDGSAVIESAEIVGLTDAVGTALPVAERNTQGIGDALLALLDSGAKRFLIALGGSSTNDGGIGMLVALGLKLYDANGNVLPPTPQLLGQLARVDVSGLDPRLQQISIIAMSDVDNPLCGEHGATAIFGPQKGVTPDQVQPLDALLGHFAELFEQASGRQAANLPGAGAAGGLGYALLMLGAQFQSGAETVADYIGLDAALTGADWLITGEGRSDVQTLHGKAPFIASQRARKLGVSTSLLSGGIDRNSLAALQTGFDGCFSIVFGPASLQDAISNAAPLLSASAEQMARLWFSSRNKH